MWQQGSLYKHFRTVTQSTPRRDDCTTNRATSLNHILRSVGRRTLVMNCEIPGTPQSQMLEPLTGLFLHRSHRQVHHLSCQGFQHFLCRPLYVLSSLMSMAFQQHSLKRECPNFPGHDMVQERAASPMQLPCRAVYQHHSSVDPTQLNGLRSLRWLQHLELDVRPIVSCGLRPSHRDEVVVDARAVCVFVWCNVILPDNRVSHCADAEVSVRGSGSGNLRTQARQVSV